MAIEDDIIELIELLFEASKQEIPPSLALNNQSRDEEVTLEMKEKITHNQKVIKQLQQKLAKLESKINNNHLATTTKHNFKQELIKHTKNFDFLKLLIITGDTYCQIKGVAFRIYEDFIILLANDDKLIKIPFTKISAIEKKQSENKQSKLNNQDKDELTEEKKKKLQEKIASLAQAKN